MVAIYQRIAILGLGLIGGSLALRCVEKGYDVVGYAPSAATRALAAEHFPVTDTAVAAVQGADLVILAVPLNQMSATAQMIAPVISWDTTITDVGSVKIPVRQALVEAGLGEQYVGAHPMAGNEKSGFAAADANLLVGAPWALTTADSSTWGASEIAGQARNDIDFVQTPSLMGPNSSRCAESYNSSTADSSFGAESQHLGRYLRLRKWLLEVFDANLIEVTDAEHDGAQALISGLPHVFAVELLNQLASSSSRNIAQQLAAGSFRDGTRVGYTDPDRTAALVSQNVSGVVPLLREAAAHFTQLADRLEAGRGYQEFFHAADSLRQRS